MGKKKLEVLLVEDRLYNCVVNGERSKLYSKIEERAKAEGRDTTSDEDYSVLVDIDEMEKDGSLVESKLVQYLNVMSEELGVGIDYAVDVKGGLEKLRDNKYDIVVGDLGLPFDESKADKRFSGECSTKLEEMMRDGRDVDTGYFRLGCSEAEYFDGRGAEGLLVLSEALDKSSCSIFTNIDHNKNGIMHAYKSKVISEDMASEVKDRIWVDDLNIDSEGEYRSDNPCRENISDLHSRNNYRLHEFRAKSSEEPDVYVGAKGTLEDFKKVIELAVEKHSYRTRND